MAFTLIALLAGLLLLIILSAFPTDRNDFEDEARMRAMSLCEAAKAWELKNGDNELKELDVLAPYLDRGDAGLLDTWGTRFQFRTVQNRLGRREYIFWTTNPTSGKVVGWPRELAEANR